MKGLADALQKLERKILALEGLSHYTCEDDAKKHLAQLEDRFDELERDMWDLEDEIMRVRQRIQDGDIKDVRPDLRDLKDERRRLRQYIRDRNASSGVET